MINCPECKTPLPGTDDEIALIASPPISCPGCKKLVQIGLDGTPEMLKAPPPKPIAPPKPMLQSDLQLVGEKAEQPNGKAARRRPTAAVAAKPPLPPPPPFPRQAVVTATRELVTWATGQRRPTQGLLALGVVVVIGGLAALVGWSFRANYDTAYVAERQVVSLGPGEGYRTLHTVTRGDELRVYEITAGFALVRDAMGRSGYLPHVTLAEDAPPAVAGLSFADCQRAPFEATGERCHERADAQLSSCNASCGKAAERMACLADCERQSSECKQQCDGAAFIDTVPAVAATRQEALGDHGAAPMEPAPKRKKSATKKKTKR
jgi:hypothetical protein